MTNLKSIQAYQQQNRQVYREELTEDTPLGRVKMVRLVLGRAIQELSLAHHAVKSNQTGLKLSSIASAYALIESLIAAIDPKPSPALAEQLFGVYEYCLFTLTKANLENDQDAIEGVMEALKPLYEAWTQIEKELLLAAA